MTKKSETVGLDRSDHNPRRGFPWGVIVVFILIVILALVGWLFQRRIGAIFAPKPTELPPPPGQSGGQALPPGVLYQDNFDTADSAKDWDIFDDGTISAAVADGQLEVGVKALSATGTWSGLNFTFEDFTLDVDATKVDGPDDNGIIIIFRMADKQNYDRFDISSDGYYSLSKARNGVPTVVSNFPINTSPAIKTGTATNHITVIAKGGTYSFSVNGTPLKLCVSTDPNAKPIWDQNGQCLGGMLADNWHDPDLTKGKIGLGAQGFVPHSGGDTTEMAIAKIGFDNLVITTPDTP
jgi:hypothetical protein